MTKNLPLSPARRLVESRRLPLGHVERKAAERAVELEYSACWDIQRKYESSMKSAWLSLRQCGEIAKLLLGKLGIRGTATIAQSTQETSYCIGKEIYLLLGYQGWAGTHDFLHELGHAVCHMERLATTGHDRDYLWALDLLYQAFMEEYK